MKTRSPFLIALVILLSLSIVVPVDVMGQATQRAGEVSRTIPDVSIARGSQQLAAPVKTLVDWGDVVRTNEGGRARVALDDGSVLNVGSSSSLTVTQHNSAAQQTQIEMEYGRVRAQVVKQSKPNAKFEIHTPVGVAGVVGTDLALECILNSSCVLIVYEGHVKWCNLNGLCVDVLGGQMATIRDGHQPPDQPTPAPPSELTEASNGTMIGPTAGTPPPHHLPIWTIVGLTLVVAIPAIVIPVATRGAHPSPGTKGLTCVPLPSAQTCP